MKPVRLPAAATLALPRWALFALGLLYILPGLIGRDPWKDDADSFGIMWTMSRGGLEDWLFPHIAGLPSLDEGPLAFWLGALCIKLFGWLLGDVLAARVSNIGMFVAGGMSLWYTAFHLGRRPEAQPLRLAFGGQPEPDDYGRTLADTAVLVYLGSLGLLLYSHETLAVTLQGSLLAYFLYRAVRYIETASLRNAALVGLSLGALTLTRGPLAPIALLLALFLCTRFFRIPARAALPHMGLAALAALLLTLVWIVPAVLVQPFGQSPVPAWLAWSADQLALPGWTSIKTFFRVGLWFFWPAWPFAGWAIWAWRRQQHMLHIVLPLTFLGALTALTLCDPTPENGDLLKLLPPLALMAAFGLPTMKRGAINAIDWFSVMALTTLAALVWLLDRQADRLAGQALAQCAQAGARLHAGIRYRQLHGRSRRVDRLDLAGALEGVAPAHRAVARGGAVLGRPDPAVGAADDPVPAGPELQQELRRRGPGDRRQAAAERQLHRHECRRLAARLVRLLRAPAVCRRRGRPLRLRVAAR